MSLATAVKHHHRDVRGVLPKTQERLQAPVGTAINKTTPAPTGAPGSSGSNRVVSFVQRHMQTPDPSRGRGTPCSVAALLAQDLAILEAKPFIVASIRSALRRVNGPRSRNPPQQALAASQRRQAVLFIVKLRLNNEKPCLRELQMPPNGGSREPIREVSTLDIESLPFAMVERDPLEEEVALSVVWQQLDVVRTTPNLDGGAPNADASRSLDEVLRFSRCESWLLV